MPTLIDSADKPTFLMQPDMRFATTFLSINNRDYSVNGESMMDKATGEIFARRPDGRVVSFFQNKKYNYDICLELRILLSNNQEFYYSRSNSDGYYVTEDYDSMSLFGEKRTDVITKDAIFPNVSPPEEEDEDNPGNIDVTDVRFKLSTDTNGFFIRVTSRDCDKAFIEFLTSEYNKRFKDYVGPDELYATEAAKFIHEKWEDSNAAIEYTVEVSRGDSYRVYTMTDYLRFNEKCAVYLPMNKINVDFPHGYDKVLVTVKAITYEKIRVMCSNKDSFGEEFLRNYNRLISYDGKIPVDYYNISYFNDSVSDIILTGNEFIVSMLDVPYVKRYMGKVAELRNSGSIFLSIDRPNDDDWVPNTIWAERVSTIEDDGTYVKHKIATHINKLAHQPYCEYIDAALSTDKRITTNFYINIDNPYNISGEIQTDPHDTDDYLFTTKDYWVEGEIQTDPEDRDDYLIEEGAPYTYTKEQFDAIMANLSNSIDNLNRNTITFTNEDDGEIDGDLDEASIQFDTVSTTERE